MRKNLKILGTLLLVLAVSLAYISCAEEDDKSKWQGKAVPSLLHGTWGSVSTGIGAMGADSIFDFTGGQMTYLSAPYYFQ